MVLGEDGPILSNSTSGGTGLRASAFTDGGEILVGKLVSTLLGGLWLTVAAGWITVNQAIVRVHFRILDAIADLYVGVIEAVGQGGAKTLRVSWAESFRAATEVNGLLAPMLFSAEVIVVSALLLFARRRWV